MESHEMVDEAGSSASQGAVVNGEAGGAHANGGGAGAERWERSDEIAVENPATGQIIGTVPAIDAAALAEMAKRAREAQIGWQAMGFEGRGEVLRRAQKWTMDNAERIISTIVAETGKTYEDAQLAELAYAANAFGFWARKAPKYLADEHVSSSQILVKGKKLRLRYRPLGLVGVIGPWNYPLTNSFGDCIPALAAGNSVILKPASLTPLTSLLMAEGMRESGLPENVFQVATGSGGATGSALIELVDMIMFTGSTEVGRKIAEAAAQAPDPVLAGARRQGPDDRARGCRHRARRQLRHLLLDAERRPDVHLDRARLRRGSGVRRLRAQGLREDARIAHRRP